MAQVGIQRNAASTVYVGNLDEEVNEDLLWELMLQAGPIVSVYIPRDKVSGQMQGYAFVEYKSEEDAEYSLRVMNMVKLFGKSIRVQSTSSSDRVRGEVGANLFIGGLSDEVDEKLLFDTFSAFGGMTQAPNISFGDDGRSKGFGFVFFDSFEASDMAMQCMNGQFLGSKQITVQYAFKKDSPGERHGSQAERLIASGMGKSAVGARFVPNQLFSTGVKERVEGPVSSLASGGGDSGAVAAPPAGRNQALMPPPPMGAAPMVPGLFQPPQPPPPLPVASPMYGYPGVSMNMGMGMPGMMPPPPPMGAPPPLPMHAPPPPPPPPLPPQQ